MTVTRPPPAGRTAVPVLCILLLAGCGDDGPLRPGPAGLSGVDVSLNPDNALSTIVSFQALGLDSARVVYRRDGGAEATPYRALEDGPNRIATLGLEPNTVYRHTVEAVGPGGAVASMPVTATSGDLPEALSGLVLEATGEPTPGYVVTADVGYVIAYDRSLRVRWYRKLEGFEARTVEQRQNGNFVAFIGSSTGHQPTSGYFLEFRPDGREVRRWHPPAPLYMDHHEFLLTGDEDDPVAHYFTYSIRLLDLSPYGGPAIARVAGHQIVRTGAGGDGRFLWNAWDHFSIEDAVDEPGLLTGCTECDFDHPNSLDIALDGNYVASFRDIGEITKLDSRTGEILWRLGGNHNQFTFVGDPLGGFSAQHYARILDDGNLLLYDNGTRHDPPETRVVEYRLDTGAMTATLVWEYRHDPPVYTAFVGSAQRQRNGNTFISLGWDDLVEVDAEGEVIWEARSPTRFYRAIKTVSLYEYVRP